MERRSCRTEAELVGTPEGLLAAFQWHAAPADEAGALAEEPCGHLDKLTVTALTYQRARRCLFQDHQERPAARLCRPSPSTFDLGPGY